MSQRVYILGAALLAGGLLPAPVSADAPSPAMAGRMVTITADLHLTPSKGTRGTLLIRSADRTSAVAKIGAREVPLRQALRAARGHPGWVEVAVEDRSLGVRLGRVDRGKAGIRVKVRSAFDRSIPRVHGSGSLATVVPDVVGQLPPRGDEDQLAWPRETVVTTPRKSLHQVVVRASRDAGVQVTVLYGQLEDGYATRVWAYKFFYAADRGPATSYGDCVVRRYFERNLRSRNVGDLRPIPVPYDFVYAFRPNFVVTYCADRIAVTGRVNLDEDPERFEPEEEVSVVFPR